MTLKVSRGDDKSLTIPMTWNDAPFIPGVDWAGIFTAKFKDTDEDSAAAFQHASGGNLSFAGSDAILLLNRYDTDSLSEGSLICDIQVQHATTGELRTVARDVWLRILQDVTRKAVTSVPPNNTSTPMPFGASVWGSITGNLPDQADLAAAMALKAPLASPIFTGPVTFVGGITAASVTADSMTSRGDLAAWGDAGINGYLNVDGNITTTAGQFIGAGTGITGTAASLTAGNVTTINGRITAGANVTLSGAGTAASPYSIAAAGGATTWTALTDKATAPLPTDNTPLANALAAKAPLANPSFTGSVATTGQFSGPGTGLTGTAASLAAGTVSSIGNLTGVVTSVNRVTSIANGAITNVMLANGAVANLSGTNTGNETAASIATALNAGTQDAAAADTDRIAVTSPAGGWMLLSTLWTWVKAKIDLGQTWAGLQSFTTRPRSSAALAPANTTELITQADMLPEFLQFIPTTLPLSTTTGTANTNGSNTGNSAVITVLNTAVAGDYREVVCSGIPIHRSGSGANIRFADSKFTLLFDLQTNGVWNSEYRFLFGVGSIQALTAAGIGVVWTGPTSGVIQIHDGTALYTQAFTIAGFDFNLIHKFALIWNAGTLKLYWKGWNDYNPEGRFALVATLTRAGLPPVSSGTTCKFVNWVTAASPGSAMLLNIREAKFLSMAPALV